jgi:hypothetical protein
MACTSSRCRFGSNSSTHGLLVMNHEYPDNGALFPDGTANWSPAKVRKSQAALGCSVQEIRLENGRWQLVRPSRYARRIHANTPMRVGGPAAGQRAAENGFEPRRAREASARSTTAPTAGRRGAPTSPAKRISASISRRRPIPPRDGRALRTQSQGAVLVPLGRRPIRASTWCRNRNEANHFGWVVEIDPFDPASVPVKRTALGRFSHEGATYGRLSGWTGGDLLRRRPRPSNTCTSSSVRVPGTRPTVPPIATCSTKARLYVARFNADGSGEWVELTHGKNGLTAANGFASQARW